MKTITAKQLMNINNPIALDDVWYLPTNILNIKPPKFKSISKELDQILRPVARHYKCPIKKIIPLAMIGALKHAYEFYFSHNKKEPEWIKLVDSKTQRHIRHWFISCSEMMDQAKIVPHFPFSDFGYVVIDNGMLMKAADVFGLHRLNNIRQLAFLYDPVYRENNPGMLSTHFNHTRFLHVLDTAALAGLIILNNKKELWEQRNLIRLAALTHDTLTPGGGDTTKLIDLKAFDEDVNYPELFKRKGWSAFRDEYGIDENLLYDTILGKGLFGRVLDIIDKISYTARDLWSYLNKLHLVLQTANLNISPGYLLIREHLELHPDVCSLWDCVRIIEGSLIVTDRLRLAAFLKLRALMFKHLYYNAASRFPEYVITNYFLKKMYETGILTKDLLLEYGDWQVEQKINDYVGIPYFINTILSDFPVEIKVFSVENEAREYAKELKIRNRFCIPIVEVFRSQTKTGADSFLTQVDGVVKTFREACPVETVELENIMQFDNSIRVYGLDVSNLYPSVRKKVINLLSD